MKRGNKMADPRKYTNALADMVNSGIVSADAVMNAALSYMSDDDEEKVEITAGSAVTVGGVEYIAVPGPERWGCTECVGNNNRLCTKLPDCGTLVFVRNGKQ